MVTKCDVILVFIFKLQSVHERGLRKNISVKKKEEKSQNSASVLFLSFDNRIPEFRER